VTDTKPRGFTSIFEKNASRDEEQRINIKLKVMSKDIRSIEQILPFLA
jgi:hypothetical protein